jgi:hypothetical protein
VHILKPFGRQLIDIGRVGMGIAVSADPVDVVVFARDPEDIGLLAICMHDRTPSNKGDANDNCRTQTDVNTFI